jgi:maltose alpha-D-glucosyltransferase / alpha-amylase
MPIPGDGAFGCGWVNVADQRRDPDWLINWMERAIRTHKE